MLTNEIMIKFTDGTTMTLSGVLEYGINDKDVYYVVKNGYRSFFNKDCVKFIGRTVDINDN